MVTSFQKHGLAGLVGIDLQESASGKWLSELGAHDIHLLN
jgi:hypothetical protein